MINTTVRDIDGDPITVSFDPDADEFIQVDTTYQEEPGGFLIDIYEELDSDNAMALGIALIRAAHELDCL